MREDVRAYIKRCLKCQKKKLDRQKTKMPMLITDTPSDAMEKVAMDIYDPLPETRRGNTHVLTIQDLLTKFSIAVPLAKVNSISVAKAFSEFFICTFGTPKAILTDQGKYFISKLNKQFAQLFKIKRILCSTYYPQSNGSLERSHQVLTEYLKFHIESEKEWDEWLPYAMHAYNISKHEGTGFTPFELVFGKKARTPSSFPSREELLTYDKYFADLADRLAEYKLNAATTLHDAKLRSKRYYDRKLNIKDFHIGDYVYELNGKKQGKFADEYLGPYKIIAVNKLNGVIVRDKENHERTIPMNRVKPAYYPEIQLNTITLN